jgi:hypothetical protein
VYKFIKGIVMGCPELTERDFFRLGNRSREGAEKQSIEVRLNLNP